MSLRIYVHTRPNEAYFSKDVYARKRMYADKVALEGIQRIAYILSEDGKGDYEDILEELEPIEKLSHARHEMHSSSDSDMDCMDDIGTQYSDGSLGYDAEQVNKKYGLVPGVSCNVGYIPEVMLTDDYDTIADYYDTTPEDIEENWNDYAERIMSEWRECKDDVSNKIRVWFYYLNEKFGTDFPSKTP